MQDGLNAYSRKEFSGIPSRKRLRDFESVTMIFCSGAARIDLLDFSSFDQSYCACMPSFRAITRQLALTEKKFSPSNGRFRWLFPRNEVHYSLGLQRKVQLDGRNTRTILHYTN